MEEVINGILTEKAAKLSAKNLELIVDNQMWTLPKYRELLFIR